MCVVLADNDNFSQGKAAYGQGNYQQALIYFDKALKENPEDASVLYYRGNTSVNLGMKNQALADYQQAYKLSDSPRMRAYCKEAISSLSGQTNIQQLDQTSALNTAYNLAKQDQIDQSLGSIQLQSALDKVRIIDNGELAAQDYILKQQLRLAQMKRETEDQAQNMQNSFYYDAWGRKHLNYSAQQVQDYLDSRHQMEKDLEQSIEKSVALQAQTAKQRAQLTEDSAASLADQLHGSGNPDGMKLNPLGTNLYVRNYNNGQDHTDIPKPPLLKTKTKQ